MRYIFQSGKDKEVKRKNACGNQKITIMYFVRKARLYMAY